MPVPGQRRLVSVPVRVSTHHIAADIDVLRCHVLSEDERIVLSELQRHQRAPGTTFATARTGWLVAK